MQLKEIRTIFHKELDSLFPNEEVDQFFFMLIDHYLNLHRLDLALQPNLIISKEEETPLFEGLSKLKMECPIQYILGTSHFFGMDLHVNKHVLIPRPETEELVAWILADLKNKETQTTILDIGTGSGCMAITMAKHCPTAKVYALDVSEEALKIAMQNALNQDVAIEFIHADILQIKNLGIAFDLIVSNPPYVRTMEKKEMKGNVLQHEPEQALFVPDSDPLLFYRNITKFAKNNLRENGALYFEINQYLGKETEQLLKDQHFSEIEMRKDLFDNDRMLKGIWTKRSQT
ncbi:peptide chain release factor N(5)-glutamine methyltransferase [Arenibacter sp. GZD96]|uniref:peptide chain release factor N(5)-glutamine methyltransferase n=1 Tax=Aurantibrevibacter litoralis TaxID=3106030 RepID=UPI002B002F07|nr:peptide chain release factor N(5)-glutamine methyltransferase [Arenibacter sp. GZD-96]MEA1786331.1 peptide chain release factor N(5)-glutamine methyltransferase [Arenibacter sp. GZD-96]